jgi:group I intron endonuclease
MIDNANSGIYVITNVTNNKKYVGSALSMRRRCGEHLRRLRANKHHSPMLQASWNKYSESSFRFEVLELVCDPQLLIATEQRWIDTLRPVFNVCKVAGSPLGTKQSEESKRKKSIAARGRPLSPEHVAKLKAAAIGRKPPCTPEIIAKRADRLRGKKRPQHAIDMTAAKRRGQKMSDASRLKMSLAAIGKKKAPFSVEHRLNISNAMTGRALSPEHIAALRVRAKLRGAPVLSKESRSTGDVKRRGAVRSEEQKTNMFIGRMHHFVRGVIVENRSPWK